MKLIGIDPGLSGAIAVLADDEITCHDMPFVEVRGKRLVDAHGLVDLIRGVGTVDMAILEHVQGVQGSGATSAFNFGRGFGLLEGVLAGLAVPTTLVRPQSWTKALQVSSDKGQHRQAAMRLWPRQAALFARVKDDGRADAALLCHWWARCGKA
jgi:crossover junction endodeoxyribonuclease RuvC